MKIVFITNNFPPIVDGVGDYTFHLANEFERNGHEVSVICSSKPEILSFIKHNNLSITVYPIISKWNIHEVYALYRKIKQIKPDWVSLQYVPYSYQAWGVPFVIPVLLVLLSILGVSLSITFHEIAIRINLSHIKYLSVGIAQRLIALMICMVSKKIITSISLYRDMLKFWSSKCKVIPVGSNIISNGELVRASRLKKDRVFITFGNRDLSVLLKAFEMLTNENDYIILKIVGKANPKLKDQISKLNKRTQQCIFTTGYLPDQLIAQELIEADIFVLPEIIEKSKQGGATLKSGALAAAFAAGLPIISTEGDMTDSKLLKSRAIMFCEYSTNGFYNCMDSMLKIQDLNTMHKAANMFYESHLSWEVIYNNYCEFLEKSKSLVLTSKKAY